MNITIILQILQILSAVLLVFFVLLHAPKGDGIANIGSAAQLFSSGKSAEKGLNKLTWIFFVVFMASSIILGLFSKYL